MSAVSSYPAPTIGAPLPAHALPPDFEPEPWAVYAATEIDAAPCFVVGQCFRPDCSCRFTPARQWQIYCCEACRQADVREARRWGHRMAVPLLIWRMHKYSRDPAQADLVRAARRYVTHLQSAWMESRRARVDAAGGGA